MPTTGDPSLTTPFSLGRLERADPRSVWKKEAGDFTPWLATEANLALLGEAIGLELELEATEKNVGPFRADILCRDTASGNWVLVENQLERTDHAHLGQLLTYAAGLKAVTIVWIANPFTEEHRAALDWLNDVTRDNMNFFGLELELWRIGDSVPAPKFNVISEPNDWSEAINSATSALADSAPTATRQLQRAYWSALSESLKSAASVVRPQKPLAQSWATFALGKSNVYLVARVNTLENRIEAYVAMVGNAGKEYFRQLAEQREAIEQEFGPGLEWRELPLRKESQIGVVRSPANPTDESDWPSQHAWLRQNLERLHKVFSKRAKLLKAVESGSGADGELDGVEKVVASPL
jgi:hypothetical protein